ncbi:Uncharacterized protein TCM_041046 [Theobroma cacao]|uniref:Integrase catalytic domain-containing protein n=1 Tax=Theobroma cacao TaxID=3641 RepID=A0A061GUE2_THECC|nr:Uncharacterized protein TCM_041046 [Theobroma cacao]
MASSNYSIAAPPVFNGNNYPMWAVKMKAYLKAFDLWEVVEVGGDPPARQANPTIAQMKQYNEEVAKRFKALSCIHSAVTDAIFVRIMACESAKEAWDKIKEEFHEDSKDLTTMSVSELINALQAQEQRRALRQEDHVEAALAARRVDKRTSSGSHKKSEYEKKDKDKRLWHRRLGHINYQFIKNMGSLNLVNDMPIITEVEKTCEIFFLKQKSEAIQYFMKFKVLVEKQTDQKIKALRSDNGSEYTSNEFKALLTQEGIKQFLTVPYSPQQNGVSERKNRTIMEMIRCLLFEQQMPKYFWAEAANFAVTLQNLIPTTALNSMTPFEVWHGYKPSISNVKVFGCIAYAQVPQQKRTKLDSKTQISINLGYSSVSKGYRLFNVETKKVFISRDVVFNEDIHWNWMKNEIAENNNDNVAVNLDVFEEEAGHEPKHQRVISVKWIFRTKLNSDGSINKLKAKLVVRGFSQVHGVDFFETFAPVARHDTIRLLVALAGREKWRIWHMDVKSAFLNGTISEDIYVEQPEGFVEKGKEDKVCKLIKALYGLKQAPRAWYKKIDAYLRSNKFFCSESEPTLYVKSSLGKIQLIVSVYVDDLLITGPNKSDLNSFRNKMKSEFDMSDLGEMSYFLGLEIQQREKFELLRSKLGMGNVDFKEV